MERDTVLLSLSKYHKLITKKEEAINDLTDILSEKSKYLHTINVNDIRSVRDIYYFTETDITKKFTDIIRRNNIEIDNLNDILEQRNSEIAKLHTKIGDLQYKKSWWNISTFKDKLYKMF